MRNKLIFIENFQLVIYTNYMTMTQVRPFISHVKKTCKNNKVKFNLSKHSVVNAKESPTAGFYDPGTRYLVVAKGRLPKLAWLPVLVHEYSHLEQEIEKDSTFNTDIKDEGAEYILDLFLMGKRKLSYKQLDLAIKKIVACEHNCEIRAVKNISRFKLGLNKEKYIKQANAYLFYYYFVQQFKFWVPAQVAAYNQDYIVDNMPNKLLSFKQYKKQYKKYSHLFKTIYIG